MLGANRRLVPLWSLYVYPLVCAMYENAFRATLQLWKFYGNGYTGHHAIQSLSNGTGIVHRRQKGEMGNRWRNTGVFEVEAIDSTIGKQPIQTG